MSGSGFPFEADFDSEDDRRRRGPLDRRDLVLTLAIAAAGAVLVGIAGVVAALELAIAPGEAAAVALSGVGPFAAWLVGALLALIRLVRRRRRAWLPMLLGVGAGIPIAVAGVLWWLAANALL